MEIAENAGAYLLNIIATVGGWVGMHAWIVPTVAGIMCLAYVGTHRKRRR